MQNDIDNTLISLVLSLPESVKMQLLQMLTQQGDSSASPQEQALGQAFGGIRLRKTVINVSGLTEELADLAHRQWARWMEYLFEKSTLNEDGTVTIPKWAVDRWKRQVNTEYKDLPEEEKESDRNEARRVIEAIFKE